MNLRRPSPAALINSQVIIAFSMVIYLVFLHLYLKPPWVKSDEFHMYALSFSTVPFLACLICGTLFGARATAGDVPAGFRTDLFLALNGSCALWLLVALMRVEFTRALLLHWVATQVILNLGLAVGCRKFKRVAPTLVDAVKALATVATALLPPAFLLLVLVGTLPDLRAHFAKGDAGPFGLQYFAMFKLGLGLFGIAVLSSMFVYGSGRSKWLVWPAKLVLEAAGIGAIGWIAVIIATTPSPDVQTMNAHLGPASFVLAHGVPFVDVFCQYGMLSYLVFDALFQFIPPSYMGAAFLVSCFDAIYLIVLALILRRILTNKFLAYGAAALVGLAIVALNFNSIPSVGAMRFLPPLVMLAAIVHIPRGRLFSATAMAAVVFCSLWSIEALIWSLVTYLSFMTAEHLIVRRSLSGLMGSIGKLVCVYLAPHVVYTLFVLLRFGVVPNYKIYLDQTFNMYGGAQAGWTWGMDFTVLIWVIAPLTYISVYACSAWLIFSRSDGDALESGLFARVLIPASILGGMELSYWVGRSLIFHFWPVIIPVPIVLAVVVDRLLPRPNRWNIGISAISCLLSIALLYGVGISEGLANASLAFNRARLDSGLAIARSPIGTADIHDDRLRQTVDLVNKWRPKEKEILIMMPGSLAAATLLYTGKSSLLHISNSHNDPSSVLLSKRALDRAGTAVNEGELLFIHEDFNQQMYHKTNLPPDPDHAYSVLEITIMFKLRTRWRMAIMERTSLGFLVLRLVAKDHWTAASGPEYTMNPPPGFLGAPY